jgi:hypothetical protein
MIHMQVTWKSFNAFEVGTADGSGGLAQVTGLELNSSKLSCWVDGTRTECDICEYEAVGDACVNVWLKGRHFQYRIPLKRWDESGDSHSGTHSGMLIAPMTARVTKVRCL